MKEKLMKIYPVVITIIIILSFFWFLNGCEKNQSENECINFIEVFQDSDYYSDYYYNKCESIFDNEKEVEICIDEMRLSTNEIKEYCDNYIESYDNYNEYNEY